VEWFVDSKPQTERSDRRCDRLVIHHCLDTKRWSTRSELRYAIMTWIERIYNRRRRQRGLGKLTPVEFELAFADELDLAA
jgi:transposase InsO family protein